MGLAFWRRNQAVARTARAGTAAERENEGAEQEALVRRRTRHRLIGATILLLAAVIIVPMILEADPRTVADNVQITMPAQPPAPVPVAAAPGAAPAPATGNPVAITAENPKSELQGSGSRPSATRSTETKVTETKVTEPKATETKVDETKAAESQAAAVKPEPAAAAPVPAGSELKAANAKEDPIAALLNAQPPVAGGRFALQAAALSSEKAARELAARLKKAGFKSYIEPVKTGGGTAHRVRVGPFDSKGSADKAREALRAAGFDAVVVDA